MSKKRQYKPNPRTKREPVENRPRGINGGGIEDNEMNHANIVDLDDDIGSESHKKQALRYFDGQSRAGKNKQFYPNDIGGRQMGGMAGDPGLVGDARNPGGPGNDLSEVVDLTRKKPYGDKRTYWSENTGKLSDLDPQETDQPGWVNTWSPLNTGPGGAGVTQDENYGVKRPRTFSRQRDRFAECNPEFQDGAGEGDWTSLKWSPDV